jgi:hypothetical protein
MSSSENKKSTNICGINVERSSITSSSNIEDQFAIKLFLCLRKKMLHFNFCLHFVDVNISPPHTFMPLQNNILWKVTHNTIHIENNFVGVE